MSKPQKYYVVWRGRQPGIYESWAQAAAQVNGFAGAQYKHFDTRAAAVQAFRRPYEDYVKTGASAPAAASPRNKPARRPDIPPPITPSYAADAACSGNPGVLEYRSVKTETGEIIFARGPFPEGTNNIGEFLGIVETLMLLHTRGDGSPVYSDSRNAIGWVAAKKCKTQLPPGPRNAALFKRIARAEQWLTRHTFPNPVLKWDTENWGEIPADYGRK